MRLKQPHLHLGVSGTPASQNYYLQTITYFNRMGYVANGHKIINNVPDADNTIYVSISVKKLADFPAFEAATPVVHTIDLGIVDFGDREGYVEVELFVEKDPIFATRSGGGKKSRTNTSTASKDIKPIPQNGKAPVIA